MIKLVLFDLDGILVNACGWHKQALDQALQETCHYTISEADHFTTFNGLPTKKKLELLMKLGIVLEEQIPKIFHLKQEFTKNTIKEQGQIDLEKIEMHKALINLNIPRVCVTNSITETARLMLEVTGQWPYLTDLISNEMVRTPKPHGEGYIRAMIKYQAYPEETLICEDSPVGLRAAYASGAHVLECKDETEVTKERVLRAIQELS